ncbi:MAG TPA: hypothetical protein DCR14_12240 [Acidimicrobiaceae bacterium]|nr:hypothetical protein [Acidimicrobiaceae bacterium]
MTRRLALVIVGVVVATLLLAGAGTLVLATARARSATEAELRGHAADTAAVIDDLLDTGQAPDTPEGQRLLRLRVRALNQLRALLPFDEITVLVVQPDGSVDVSGLPQQMEGTALDIDDVLRGTVQSGTNDRTAWAAAAASTSGPGGRTYVVVLTERVDAGLGPAVRLFVWAGAITIALGLVAALLLGRHLTRPIRDAAVAARHIAGGKLSTRVEQPPASRTDELADLQRSINDMAATLERSRGLEQQFLLSVSHDLRTPLTSIRGFAEAIGDGAGDPQQAATVIRRETARLERLVADLLDLAKLQSRSFTFNNVALDMAAAVHTAARSAAGAYDRVSVTARASGPLMVHADPDRVHQVLANLAENAAKYARASVTISAAADGADVVVWVDDDGPGIAAHDLPHVFERLYVARHVPERRENASGLGLAIVHELVEGMSGTVHAGSSPSGGARLSFRLPRLMQP